MPDTIPNLHQWERGPKIVAIGGGTGLSTMLRGLKKYTKNLTAIVTVADDGGGSGHAAAGPGHAPAGGYPPLHGGPGQRGADDGAAADLPLSGGLAWPDSPSAT